MTRPLVSARALSKSFSTGAQRIDVVRDLDLDVPPASFTLVKGPAGCGKSTLLAMLAGLTPPDAGRVTVAGTDIWGLSAKARNGVRLASMGFVFQGSILLPGLSAADQMAVLLVETGLDPAEAAARAALAGVGLAGRAHLKPAELSGGVKQRVAIALAPAKRPSLVFADEPTSALDTENAESVGAQLRDHAGAVGAAVICVTHDDRLLSFADRILRKRAGRIASEQIVTRRAA